MRIPAFIKQLAKFCDADSARFALGGVQCTSDGKVEQLTATDGHVLANVWCYSEDRDTVSAIADGKVLSSPPVAAFKRPVRFDGKTLQYGGSFTTVEPIEGRFPRYEDVFDPIHEDESGYVSVKLDGELLRKLADLAAAMSDDSQTKGITLFVKDATSAVYASCNGADGYIARMAIMPRASDAAEPHNFPPRPGEQPVETPQPKAKGVTRTECNTVPAEGVRAPRTTVSATTGVVEPPAPPPEMLDDDAIAAAVTREPECVGMAFSVPDIE
jgi:hypothetical protein